MKKKINIFILRWFAKTGFFLVPIILKYRFFDLFDPHLKTGQEVQEA